MKPIEPIEGIARIDRVVEELTVWLDGAIFPVPNMRVKVFKRDADFLAVANLHVLTLSSKQIDYISGLGGSVEEAVNDLLVRFVAGVRRNTPPNGLSQDDFSYSAPEDF